MVKEKAARTQVVDKLMTLAIVTEDDGLYRVIVPGAIREENVVAAKSEEEALKKVRNVLVVKEVSRLESQKKVAEKAAAGEDTSDGSVAVSPDTLKVKTKGLPPKEVL